GRSIPLGHPGSRSRSRSGSGSAQTSAAPTTAAPAATPASGPPVEAIVDAGHDHVDITTKALAAEEHAAGCHEGCVAITIIIIEEYVVVLDADRPTRRETVFETDTNRTTPTGVGVTPCNDCVAKKDVSALVNHRGAALDVEQNVVPGVSD